MTLDRNERLVGFTADSRALVTEVREEHLISGRSETRYWSLPGDTTALGKLLRATDRPPIESQGCAFAADGKSYRTVVPHRDPFGELSKFEVVEVDATTGKQAKSLRTASGRGRYALSDNGKRFAVLNGGATQVTIYELDKPAAEPLTVDLPSGKDETRTRPTPDPDSAFLVLSPDGKRLVVSRGISWSAVLDTDTGKALPELEGAKEARMYVSSPGFGAGGRLFVAVCQTYRVTVRNAPGEKEQTEYTSSNAVLTVWDVQSGKALKTWKCGGVRGALNPVRPVLVVLEANGEENIRVGFWDFAAEAEKK